jgi:ornithine cyclodeaminase/alanine dehydrogenase-like protein (mu-crystallin family)
VRPLASVTYLVRSPRSSDHVLLGSIEAAGALRAAHVIVCATSARAPLFSSAVVREDVVVIAASSHEPDVRELDAVLMSRATVVVGDVATALREAGDVVLACSEGALARSDLVPMCDVVTGVLTPPRDRPLVLKSVGMSWQDLVIAEAVVVRSRRAGLATHNQDGRVSPRSSVC